MQQNIGFEREYSDLILLAKRNSGGFACVIVISKIPAEEGKVGGIDFAIGICVCFFTDLDGGFVGFLYVINKIFSEKYYVTQGYTAVAVTIAVIAVPCIQDACFGNGGNLG